jgi:hypothetical protein
MCQATHANDIVQVKRLIQNKVSPSAADYDGRSGLVRVACYVTSYQNSNIAMICLLAYRDSTLHAQKVIMILLNFCWNVRPISPNGTAFHLFDFIFAVEAKVSLQEMSLHLFS